jgi:HAD superfamily hydrolase (TIGR01509 family)
MTELAVKELKLPILSQQFRMMRQTIYEELLETSRPQPVLSTIDFLRTISRQDYKVGMATSEHIRDINRYLVDINVHPNNFDAIVSADEVKNDKPFPDVYLECAKRLKVKPVNCLAIEDSPPGIESAKSAGMICIAQRLPHNHFLDLTIADLVVDTLSQIQIKQLEERFFDGK